MDGKAAPAIVDCRIMSVLIPLFRK